MKNLEHSSDKSSKGGWVSQVLGLILSYYSKLISNPFKSGLVYIAAGLVPALILGWVIFPMVLYSKQEQPINFNHAVHLEDMECSDCHSFRDDGTFTGIPKLESCIECHEEPQGESKEEERFIAEYVLDEDGEVDEENTREIPWLSYSRQPDCVYFSHIAHVEMGKLECRTCHGDHDKTETLPVYKKNRITGYSINIWGKNIAGLKKNSWDRMKMDDCAECHTKKGREENNACFVCHK